MKKFQFSLGRVLDYKDQLLEREKNTLAQLRQQRQAIEDKMDSYRREFDAVNEELQHKSSEGVTVNELRGFDYQLQSIRYQQKLLQVEHKNISAAIERQLAVVLVANQEVSGLDKLEEKQREEYNHEVAKADELVIAEYVSSKIIRQKEA